MLFILNPTPESLMGQFDGRPYPVKPRSITKIKLDDAARHIQQVFSAKGLRLIEPDDEGIFSMEEKEKMYQEGQGIYLEFLKQQIQNFNHLNQEQGRQGLPVFATPKYLTNIKNILLSISGESISIDEPRMDAVSLLQRQLSGWEAQNEILKEQGKPPLEETQEIKSVKAALSLLGRMKETVPEIEEPQTVSGRSRTIENLKMAKKKEEK